MERRTLFDWDDDEGNISKRSHRRLRRRRDQQRPRRLARESWRVPLTELALDSIQLKSRRKKNFWQTSAFVVIARYSLIRCVNSETKRKKRSEENRFSTSYRLFEIFSSNESIINDLNREALNTWDQWWWILSSGDIYSRHRRNFPLEQRFVWDIFLFEFFSWSMFW